MATRVRTTSRAWEHTTAPTESNTGEGVVSSVVVPSKKLVDDLLARLAVRSTSPSGFDRETLRTLNDNVWGASEG